MRHFEILTHNGPAEVDADIYEMVHGWVAFYVLNGEEAKEEVLLLKADQVYAIYSKSGSAQLAEPQIDQVARPTPEIMGHFEYSHLPEGIMRDTSARCGLLAAEMTATLPLGPELSAGLRKLLEAKDCFVRASRALL